MKVKNYILASFLASSILILCIMPEWSCTVKEKRLNVYDSESNLSTLPRDKMQGSSTREKSGDGKDKKRFCEEKETLTETYRLQYAQLLETHRCYLTALLFTLSTYLAVMGACFTIVCKSIEEMKKDKNPEKISKTLLLILIFFAMFSSFLFMVGLYLGERDATERTPQIHCAAKQMGIQPIKVELLKELFRWIMIGPMVMISLLFAVLFRGMMGFGWRRPLVVEILSYLIAIVWFGGYILSLLSFLPSGLSPWIIIGSTIVVVIWFAVWFINGVIVCRRLERPT